MNGNVLVIIGLMAVITYLTRFPMLLISSRMTMPDWLRRGLRMVPVGVFSSLTLPPLLFHMREGSWNAEYLVAGVVSLAVGLWKRQIVLSLLAGVAAVVLYRSVG
ncbi:AzlD domain-containing protein [Brevibacillus sp. SYP-B805]|uniref:AzlD domain-containing protein n=1 Tax=Brevibacillus sp. SYP-B805 TaxID=1578199 RepID=UPI003217D1F6